MTRNYYILEFEMGLQYMQLSIVLIPVCVTL